MTIRGEHPASGKSNDERRQAAVVLLQGILDASPAIKEAIASNLDRFDDVFFDLIHELCQNAQVRPEETRTTLRSLSWLIAEALFAQALAAYRAGNSPMALTRWEQAVPAYEQALSPNGVANCLGNAGVAYELRGEYTRALDYLQRALAIDRAENDREGQIKRLNNLGSLLLGQGEIEEGAAYCQQALVLSREIGDRRGEAASLSNLALVHQDRGELEEALVFLQQARMLDEADQDRRGLAVRLGNLGRLYHQLGRPAVALAYYQQALNLFHELGDVWGMVDQHNNIGLLQFVSGKLRTALVELHTALNQAQEIGYRPGEASVWNNLGLLYQLSGELKEAAACQRKALALYEQIGDVRGQAMTVLNLGNLIMLSGEFDQAMRCQETALAIYRTIGYKEGEADAMGNIGALHHLHEQLDEADAAYQAALGIFQAIGDRLGEAERLGSLGAVRQQQGELAAAIDLQTQAIALVREVGQPDLAYRLLVSRGFSWSRLGNERAALTDFLAAIETIEALREQLADEMLRTRFFGYDKMLVYREAVLRLSRLGKVANALNYAEQSRSRTFLDLLAWTELHVSSDFTLEEFRREAELRRALRSVALAQQKTRAEAMRRTLALQYSTLQEELEATLEAIRQSAPEYVALRQAAPASYADIRRCTAGTPADGPLAMQ